MRTLLSLLTLGLLGSSAPPQGDPLAQKIDLLVAAVNVEDNPRVEFPGEGFLDLPPQALPLLRTAAKRKDLRWTARACIAKGIRKLDERSKGLDWAVELEARRLEFQRLVAREYERVSARDPRWDKFGLESTRGAAAFWGAQFRRTNEQARQVGMMTEAAFQAGCDDPLVVYIHARMRQGTKVPLTEVVALHERAAKALEPSKYHPLLRSRGHSMTVDAIVRAAGERPDDEAKTRVEEHLKKAIEHFVAALAADPELHAWTIKEHAQSLWKAWAKIGDPKQAFDPIFEAIRAARPKSALPDLIAGAFNVDYAWDARGNGWAKDVKPEAWALFRDRLTEARARLEAAWTIDPTEVLGPETMMSVTLGDSRGRGEMDLWFDRGLGAYPDDYSLCSSKLNYLEPKWHGSPEEMLRFGRQCALTGNWDANLPWVLLDAHLSLARYGKNGYQNEPDYAYFDNAAVWGDVKALYERHLQRNPKETSYRATFAFYAGHARHWKEANEQFQILGDNPAALGIFRTPEQYRTAKEEAARRAKGIDF